MRKIRNTAIAGATALALTFGGVSAAGAEEVGEGENVSLSSVLSSVPTGGSSELGDAYEADERGNGEDALGEEVDKEATPAWLQEWTDLTTLAGVGTVIGAIIGAVNFFQFVNAR